ncbi:MAG: heavy metal transporter [Thalassobius sp.]|nr:heavy metal transporter [Thalassovita sp.]
MKTDKKLISLGLLTAISASLCCITPILALLAGTSGLASTFSWLNPLRPVFIGVTVLILAFAWSQKLKPQKQIDCDCNTVEKTPFIQSKKFLGIVTILTGVMLSFPSFAHVFYPKSENKTIAVEPVNIKITEFKVTGMTCTGCEEHVNHEVNKLSGIINTKVSYESGNAIIEFDESKTDKEAIAEAIAKTGYSVTDQKEIR